MPLASAAALSAGNTTPPTLADAGRYVWWPSTARERNSCSSPRHDEPVVIANGVGLTSHLSRPRPVDRLCGRAFTEEGSHHGWRLCRYRRFGLERAGVTWLPDGTIVFATLSQTGLATRVCCGGTANGTSSDAARHLARRSVSPVESFDGETVLFTIIAQTNWTGRRACRGLDHEREAEGPRPREQRAAVQILSARAQAVRYARPAGSSVRSRSISGRSSARGGGPCRVIY